MALDASPQLNSQLRRIVDRAARLFDNHGYDRVTVEDIANAAGIGKATIYHYVKRKDDILVLLHREFMDMSLAKLEAPERQELSPIEQLTLAMEDMLLLQRTHRHHTRVFFHHHRELPPAARKEIMLQRDRYSAIVEGIIRAGIAAGEIRPVNPRLASLGVFGMVNWSYQWFDPRGSLGAEEIARTFADFILNGLRQKGGTGTVRRRRGTQ
jgi:AcrR family transcriptional regulator